MRQSSNPSKVNLEDEAEIIWLHPPENYSYLREREAAFNQRRSFPKNFHPAGRQPADGDHLVAYAVVKPSVRWDNGYFNRRYWWVKKYDQWKDRPPVHGEDPYTDPTHCPMEAVRPDSIKVGQESTPGRREDALTQTKATLTAGVAP